MVWRPANGDGPAAKSIDNLPFESKGLSGPLWWPLVQLLGFGESFSRAYRNARLGL
jgi:hypothetical protein